MLLKYLFPPSLFFTATSLLTLASMANGGLAEVRGKHVQYSKFFGVGSQGSKASQIMLPTRAAMVIVYTPGFLNGVASFLLFPDEGFRFLLLKSAITIHFSKRVFEALFIHKYSGKMGLDTLIFILVSYLVSTASMIYSQHLTQGVPEPPIDLKYPGIVLFLIGVSGNFYHHYLLSKLRGKGDNEYKIPKGGFFALVACPHYLFEVLGFWGITFISQTLYTFSFTLGSTLYLMGRSYATRKWYLSKFEDFPKGVKAMIPYIF
ncbi:very-long-chain enoyl-CoA reductase-like [Herrania umbratica]|uniref:Very-long-chain enoyl-CoA reductase-like n=1 Tax=Herrania umbratica TaxID=108875 RepID=A0A6J1BC16_9ROSI|nr:very-long-chain enoyl-CoA reductase-like [Herrania umbratica]